MRVRHLGLLGRGILVQIISSLLNRKGEWGVEVLVSLSFLIGQN